MARSKPARKGWRASWAALQRLGVTLSKGDATPDVCDTPRAGEPHRGLTVRDQTLEEVDLTDLTLPRTLFAGCRFHGVTLRGTDLSLCCLRGCQFVDCDLSGARLVRADLRDCGLFACRFAGADLTGADLRGAEIEHPDFAGATLTGTLLDRALKDSLPLTEVQRDLQADWRQEGDEGPDGE